MPDRGDENALVTAIFENKSPVSPPRPKLSEIIQSQNLKIYMGGLAMIDLERKGILDIVFSGIKAPYIDVLRQFYIDKKQKTKSHY